MRYRPLGSSGIQVSEIGFGAWGIGGRTTGATSYGATDDAVSRRALLEAFDRGINFFDTASVYGDGHSERLIGECFKDRRGHVVIATKAGILPSFSGYDFSADALRRSLEGSLRRLRIDCVDVLQLHNAGPDVISGNAHITELMARFVEEGKVRAYGFSTPTPEDALKLVDFPSTACFQVNLNLIDWRAVDCGLLQRAAERNIAIIARTPMAFGFLTDAITRDMEFEASDHRTKWPRDRMKMWLDAADAVFLALDPKTEAQRGQTALRFCLSFDAVATVIPGMLTPDEVRANAAASNLGPLDARELHIIKRVYGDHRARLEL